MHPSFILYGAGIAPYKSLPGVKSFDVGALRPLPFSAYL
jgi:hypothetical protein